MRNFIFLLGTAAMLYSCQKQFSAQEKKPLITTLNITGKFPINPQGAGGIAGESWSDSRDNFVDDNLILKGLHSTDSYATVQATAGIVLTAFKNNEANTVRLPINYPTVSSTWWNSYTGAIDKALSMGMKVILCCWDSKTLKDGQIDNPTQFYAMWNIVIAKYGSNSNVFFEIFNEPNYPTDSAWLAVAAQWLNTYPTLPRSRIIVSGTGGYDNVVTVAGADSRFNSCLLALHFYRFFYYKDTMVVNTSLQTVPQWETLLQSKIGSYASRTVMTEFGDNLDTHINYNASPNNIVRVAAMQAINNVLHNSHISSVLWAGYGQGGYDMNVITGSTSTLNSPSALDQIKYGWGEAAPTVTFDPAAYYKIVNVNSGYVLDVSQGSLLNSAPLIQYPYNSGTNQQWQIIAVANQCFKLINRKSGKVIDVAGSSQSSGAGIIQYTDNGGNNQQWHIDDLGNGTYEISNRNSNYALDVNQGSLNSGAGIVQNPWDSTFTHEKWQIVKL